MPDFDEEKVQKMMEEAFERIVTKWLDRQFQMFGRWTFFGALSLLTVGLAYLSAKGFGWRR